MPKSNPYIDQEFLTYTNENPIDRLESFLMTTMINMKVPAKVHPELYAMQACEIINGYCRAHNLIKIELAGLNARSAVSNFLDRIRTRYEALVLKEKAISYEEIFKKQGYPLSDDEIQKIQDGINNLRDRINSSEDLNKEHKARILKKLNEMQTELNKNMSTFDNIIGKSVNVIKLLSYGRKEVVTPIMKDAIELTKELNRVETIHSGLPDVSNQIEFDEVVETELLDA